LEILGLEARVSLGLSALVLGVPGLPDSHAWCAVAFQTISTGVGPDSSPNFSWWTSRGR